MEYTKRNRNPLIILTLGYSLGGLLLWEAVERLLRLGGSAFSVTLPPLELDLHVIQLALRLNPGLFLGAALGYFLFRKL